jgi:hypothetical protein
MATLLLVVVAVIWLIAGETVSTIMDLLEDKLAAGTKLVMVLALRSTIVPAMLLTNKLDDESPEFTV